MVKTLEEVTGAILIDTSIESVSGGFSLPGKLFEGLEAMRDLDIEVIEACSQKSRDIARVVCGKHSERIYVIEEVIKELEKKLDLLRNHYIFFRDQMAQRRSGKKPEKGTKDYRKLGALAECCCDLFQTINSMKNRDPRNMFGQTVREAYEKFFNMSVDFSKDIQRISLEDKSKHKSPCNLGAALQTDRKIIATAFTLAYAYPVTILTADRGIKALAMRLGENLNATSVQRKYDIRGLPSKPVEVYNVDLFRDEDLLLKEIKPYPAV